MKASPRQLSLLQKNVRARSVALKWQRELRKVGGMTRKLRRDR